MREIYKLIGVLASNTITVLIEGETGTGKDLVARAIHAGSERKDMPFVQVDCGALPDELLESELFGYEAGAFTGAKTEGKPGRFELADGGTLFLNEVANMSAALQVKLLRTLQTQEIERLGGTRTLKVDVRVIAATNQELGQMVKVGQFRADLYYRFKRIALHLPPLRQRKEDIPLLITHFLQLIQDELGKPIRGISEEGTKLLQNYAWPGNVRELENCLRSAATFSRSDVILPEDLPTEIHTGPSTVLPDASQLETSLISALQDIAKAGIAEGSKQLYDDVVTLLDKTIIELALDECSNNHSKTAELLGISRTTLIKKMKQHSITKNGK
jgi:two-component system nitrogen regulation response regulator GlnG